MNKFYDPNATCDRCKGSLKKGRIMSMFNEECICMVCKKEETKRPDYNRARLAEAAHVREGDYNFKGIGLQQEVKK